MRRFFSIELGEGDDGTIVLDLRRSHHLLRVTGIGRGELVGLFDGSGRGCRARLVDVREGRAVLVREGELLEESRSGESWLLLGLSRAKAFDVALRMATELGVSHIWPILADRSVVRSGRLERWERICRAALGQSGGLTAPLLQDPVSLAEALSSLPDGVEARLLTPGAGRRAATWAPVAALIGPEGGWSPAERELALSRGCLPTGLGLRTLRVDTAVAAVLGSLRPPQTR